MRVFIRSLGTTLLALLGAIVVAVAWTAATAVQLTATALIMGGTGNPLTSAEDDPITYINPYMSNAVNGFINAAADAGTGTGGVPISRVEPGDDRYAVITPEEFFPVAGSMTFDDSVVAGLANLSRCVRGSDECVYNNDPLLDPGPPASTPVAGDEFVIFGYSQSAVVASLLKREFIENPDDAPLGLSFFLLSNPMRPNGGFLSRGPQGWTIPILEVTFYGPTPTNSCEAVGDCYETVDAAVQYDGLGGDAAVGLTNILAVINATLGYVMLHGDAQEHTLADALYQGSYGDTDYYIIPTKRLPLLQLFDVIVPSPILTLLNAPLQTLIEGAYARDVNPGVHVPVSLLPFRDPVATLINFLRAIPVGIDDALAELTGNPAFRPLGTTPPTSPFGVGGPELPPPPESLVDDSAFSMAARVGDGPEQAIPESEPAPDLDEKLVEGPAEAQGVTEALSETPTTPTKTTPEPTTVATTPSKPKVRGPITFDSQENLETTSAPSAPSSPTTTATPSEPETGVSQTTTTTTGFGEGSGTPGTDADAAA